MICLSFDNLGGIAEGDLDPAHPSLTTGLPRILALVERLGLPATFCIEGFACELFPEAVERVRGAGFELALHAWKHERWGGLGPGDEARLLGLAVAAFTKRLGEPPRGFRPPGGRLTDRSAELLSEHGIRWVSAAEGEQRGFPGPAFTWRRVDAMNVIERFGGRETPEACFARWLEEAVVHEADAPGAPFVCVAHPFCAGLDPQWSFFERFVTELAARLGAAFRPLGAAG
jgi:peptidoglycan/xylan/chitin deacetylase (PgdA/CDA1 family)